MSLAIAISAPVLTCSGVMAADSGQPHSDRETPTVLAIRRCSGAVVNIHGQKTVRATAASTAGASDAGRQVNGMGTGIVIDPRGYVITNYHVVEDVDQVQITLADGTTTTADVVAAEIRSDLALLKVDTTEPLETIPRGTSSDLMVGEPVIAIGNAFGYVHTATEGIISALHRDVPVNDTQEYRDLIQTSAGINPGNSGGPLLNIHGEIIGVNVAVRIGAQQIAFAIPIDQAIDIVSDMISSHNEDRLSLGARVEGGPRDGDGAILAHIAASSPAARQGLKVGDRIVRVGDRKTNDRLDFGLALIEVQSGESVDIQVEREGQSLQLAVTPDAAPATMAADAQALAWTAIGVKVQPVPKATMQRVNSRIRKSYRGGLLVSDVRKGSPADSQGIRSGDILIGLHGFQTSSINELQGILNKVAQQEPAQGQFLIVRSDQTMYGYMRLAELPGARRR
ncbi:MAG: trypsin-like peptidase domain-containing protein [Planctomycetaceae bacterium]